MTKKCALITGITGQDGSYLAEFLLAKGYDVHGIVRRVALHDPEHRLSRILAIRNQVQLHAASMESYASLHQVVESVRPSECYHLAAQSFVSYSFDDEFSTLDTNINGTHYLLAALKNLAPKCRFYFAGSSEMFGKAEEVPQRETTKFHPRSSYGISKVAGYELTRNYREAYGMFACSGILFNHESPRRAPEIVTKKIARAVARWACGERVPLGLGDLTPRREWGFAGAGLDRNGSGLGGCRSRGESRKSGKDKSSIKVHRHSQASRGLQASRYVSWDECWCFPGAS